MDRLVEAGVGPEFLLSEANNYRSRDNIKIGANQTLKAGTILGLISIGALSSAAVAVAGNTGAATITASPPVAAGTPLGIYTLTAVSAGATAAFMLESPLGIQMGEATTGTPATIGGIGPFTITDAGTDPAVGDQFRITVSAAPATEQDRYVIHDPEGVNGSQNVAAILYDAVITGAGETADGVGIVRDAEVIAARLVWADHDDSEKKVVIAALKAAGVIVRT